MDDRDYENYTALYTAMTDYLRAPDLLIYLKADIDTLIRQIRLRGRDFEQGIGEEYLTQLNTLYEDWIQRYSKGKLLVIDTDKTDFVHNNHDREELLYAIQKATRGLR
jgi:deoxyadenosine/deoxycytidine kinase